MTGAALRPGCIRAVVQSDCQARDFDSGSMGSGNYEQAMVALSPYQAVDRFNQAWGHSFPAVPLMLCYC